MRRGSSVSRFSPYRQYHQKAVAESLLVVADSSKSHSEIAAEKRKIVRFATKHVLTMAGSLLENIKADDKFFGE